MPDGLYKNRGWEPLPCEEEEYRTGASPMKLAAFWAAICLGVALVGMMIMGFVRKGNKEEATYECQ